MKKIYEPKLKPPVRIMAKNKDYWKPLGTIAKAMSDPDKDGYPNAIDCVDLNPNKQGALSWVIAKMKGKTHDKVEQERYTAKSKSYAEKEYRESQYEKEPGVLKKLGNRIKDYQAKAPERRAANIEKLKYEVEAEKLKTEKANLMGQRQRQSMALTGERQRQMGILQMPKMGMGFGTPSMSVPKMPKINPMNPFGSMTETKTKKKPKKKITKKKGKKKVVLYV